MSAYRDLGLGAPSDATPLRQQFTSWRRTRSAARQCVGQGAVANTPDRCAKDLQVSLDQMDYKALLTDSRITFNVEPEYAWNGRGFLHDIRLPATSYQGFPHALDERYFARNLWLFYGML